MSTTKIVGTGEIVLTKVDAENAVDYGRTSILRVEFSSPLTGDQRSRLAQVVGYAWASTVRTRGRALGDSTYMVDNRGVTFFGATFHLTRRNTDLDLVWLEFVEAVTTYMTSGTPVRATNREGVGTKGTRKVERVLAPNDFGTVSFWVNATRTPVPSKIELDLSGLTRDDVGNLLAVIRDFGLIAKARQD
jgi:hypothetical protein